MSGVCTSSHVMVRAGGPSTPWERNEGVDGLPSQTMTPGSDRYAGVLRFSFGDNPRLADELLALVLEGRKTATCCALEQAKREGWMMKPGDISIARDSSGRDRCVIETVEATQRRFCDVDASFAFDEGEDDRSLASWRREHGLYFARNGGWSEDMMLYCERFRVVEVLP